MSTYPISRHRMCSFKLQMYQNWFSAGSPTRTPLGSLRHSPRFSSWLREGTPTVLVVQRFGVPSYAKIQKK